jgi:ketol-acid reductoisomerase
VTVYYDNNIDPSLIQEKRDCVPGFGAQGRARLRARHCRHARVDLSDRLVWRLHVRVEDHRTQGPGPDACDLGEIQSGESARELARDTANGGETPSAGRARSHDQRVGKQLRATMGATRRAVKTYRNE